MGTGSGINVVVPMLVEITVVVKAEVAVVVIAEVTVEVVVAEMTVVRGFPSRSRLNL